MSEIELSTQISGMVGAIVSASWPYIIGLFFLLSLKKFVDDLIIYVEALANPDITKEGSLIYYNNKTFRVYKRYFRRIKLSKQREDDHKDRPFEIVNIPLKKYLSEAICYFE